MGLLDFLPTDNPFLKGVRDFGVQNRNTFQDIGFGLMKGKNFSDGLKEGAKRSETMAPLRAQEAIRMQEMQMAADEKNQTVEWLTANYPQYAGLPPAEGFQAAMRDMGQQQQRGGITQDAEARTALADAQGLQGDARQEFILTGRLPGGNQTVRAGVGQPIFGRNTQTGEIQPWQSMTDGTMINTADPNANPADYDFNPGIVSGARATGTVDAKTAGAARAALPAAQQQREVTLQAIDLVTTDQAGLDEWFGQFGPRGVYVHPGSKMGTWVANFSQANNQAFLQARMFLKGQGAITEMESAKAEGAYSRMAAAKETGDKQSFLMAAADFKQAVMDGYAKLEETAAGGHAQDPMLGGGPAPTAPAAGGRGGYTVLGVE